MAAREAPSAICSCGPRLHSAGRWSKGVQTVLGWITVEQRYARCPACGTRGCPCDPALGLGRDSPRSGPTRSPMSRSSWSFPSRVSTGPPDHPQFAITPCVPGRMRERHVLTDPTLVRASDGSPRHESARSPGPPARFICQPSVPAPNDGGGAAMSGQTGVKPGHISLVHKPCRQRDTLLTGYHGHDTVGQGPVLAGLADHPTPLRVKEVMPMSSRTSEGIAAEVVRS